MGENIRFFVWTDVFVPISYKQKIESLPAPAFLFDAPLIKSFVRSLPFALTDSQRLATWEILKDLQKPHPMNRLLQGEVGSGKTVVAGIAMLEVAHAGFQSVLLSPTEILAWQHFETLKKLYKNTDISLAILTRSHKEVHNSPCPSLTLREGVIVGTHALLQEKVQFQNIGLLVVDEQHRFGVKQRGQLLGHKDPAGGVPHLLSMTATPIPRTLALAFYGDLSISELRQLPSGRKKIITRLVSPENRGAAYEFIRKEIAGGRQAYVVVPLVGESPHLTSPTRLPDGQARGEEQNNNEFPPLDGEGKEGVKSVIDEQKKLQQIFPEFHVGLVHGRLPAEEKKLVMDDFHKGRIHILVSTTVVEVGVDCPNASIMVIENAERFGLSQLHQLRGRVGRAGHQSYCLLFTENFSEQTRQRLEAVVSSTDGFKLSEIDLKLRGPGQIMGVKQSGYLPLRIARLSDRAIIRQAKAEAQKLLENDPGLNKNPRLLEKAARLASEAHLE